MTQAFYQKYKNLIREVQGARGRIMREGEIVDMLFDESEMPLPSCKSMAQRIKADLVSEAMALGVEIDKAVEHAAEWRQTRMMRRSGALS